MDSQDKPRSQQYVTAFARGLAVLEAFKGTAEPLSLADVAKRAEIDRAVARRSLLTLIELGYVVADRRTYHLTPKILRLAYSYLAQSGMDGRLQPYADKVASELKEACSISILDGLETVGIAHAPSPVHKTGFLMRPGTRMPAFVMTSGRILLASRIDVDAKELIERIRG